MTVVNYIEANVGQRYIWEYSCFAKKTALFSKSFALKYCQDCRYHSMYFSRPRNANPSWEFKNST